MSRNGSGVYTPPAASYPAVSGTLIEAAKFNAVIDDIATAMTESVAINGQTAMTGALPMGGSKVTGLANGTSATDACAYGQAGSAAIVETVAATTKATPVNDDLIPISDSAAAGVLKKLTWANLKATLKTYFDGIYILVGGDAGTPSALVGTNISGTAASLTAGISTATSGVKTSGANVVISTTAPSSGQVLTASSDTAAAWETPSGGTGNLVAFTKITATDASWDKQASTTKIIVMAVGGGGAGGAGGASSAGGAGGEAGSITWGVDASPVGPYVATVGAAG